MIPIPLHFNFLPTLDTLFQLASETHVSMAKSIANDIIIADPTPQVSYLYLQNPVDVVM
jgi:hypothetical protein